MFKTIFQDGHTSLVALSIAIFIGVFAATGGAFEQSHEDVSEQPFSEQVAYAENAKVFNKPNNLYDRSFVNDILLGRPADLFQVDHAYQLVDSILWYHSQEEINDLPLDWQAIISRYL